MKNLRGVVSRDLYCRNAEYDQMPMLLTFKFTQWLRKEHRTVKVVFDYDGKEDDLDLHYVFAVGGKFEWRPGELDGRVPRRSALPRLREAAMREVGSRAERAPAAARQMVDINYEENGETKQQRWFVEEPHSVLLRATVDEEDHVLVHIKNVPGWQGMPRQRCSICKKGAVTNW